MYIRTDGKVILRGRFFSPRKINKKSLIVERLLSRSLQNRFSGLGQIIKSLIIVICQIMIYNYFCRYPDEDIRCLKSLFMS